MRFSNLVGTKPLRLTGVHAGLQLGGAAILPGTNRRVTFGGAGDVAIAPGEVVWSDPVGLAIRDPGAAELSGRKLAVSFRVEGESGPMTWHAKALQTSYVSPPGSAAVCSDEGEAAFPYPTASWFFLDALEMAMPEGSSAIVCFGNSITDGTCSTMNGDDRWPDVLARRLYARLGNRIGVVNAGIGGNQIAGPARYGAAHPFPGGPSGQSRIERDVLGLSGVKALVWLEGINDFSANGNASLDTVTAALSETIGRVRAASPGIRVIGGTVLTAIGTPLVQHGSAEQNAKRQALNRFIRMSGLYDAVIDFDAMTVDPATGCLKPEFVPDSTIGGPGDRLHPNRVGYLAMAMAVDLAVFGAIA